VSDEYPKFFYKYRSITNTTDLEKDYAIEALLNNQAIFSSRTNFNDLFDSKIELVRPTPRQIKELSGLVNKSEKANLRSLIKNGSFTPQGFEFIKGIEDEFNRKIDSYPFLSLSANPISNLMWSHYSNSHSGFCIEFKSEFLKAEKVTYSESTPKLNTIDILRANLNLINGEELGNYILQSLKIKLSEWLYESEYRFHASNSMGKIPTGEKFIKFSYKPEFVESIIFGCRMPVEFKKFIAERVPDNINIKQAVARTSRIEIINSDLRVGL
jgi:hypothetical protein